MREHHVTSKAQCLAAIKQAQGTGEAVEVVWTHDGGRRTSYRFPAVPAHKVGARAKRLERLAKKLNET